MSPAPRGRGRPATRRTRRVFKNAKIGRFNGTLNSVGFEAGDLVRDLLTRASLSLKSGDEINDERGNQVHPEDKAKETTYYVTSNYKNGCN